VQSLLAISLFLGGNYRQFITASDPLAYLWESDRHFGLPDAVLELVSLVSMRPSFSTNHCLRPLSTAAVVPLHHVSGKERAFQCSDLHLEPSWAL